MVELGMLIDRTPSGMKDTVRSPEETVDANQGQHVVSFRFEQRSDESFKKKGHPRQFAPFEVTVMSR
jgi:hypothetical protein